MRREPEPETTEQVPTTSQLVRQTIWWAIVTAVLFIAFITGFTWPVDGLIGRIIVFALAMWSAHHTWRIW